MRLGAARARCCVPARVMCPRFSPRAAPQAILACIAEPIETGEGGAATASPSGLRCRTDPECGDDGAFEAALSLRAWEGEILQARGARGPGVRRAAGAPCSGGVDSGGEYVRHRWPSV